MKTVPIAEFKAHCSQYIEELGREEIVITRHGKPVARVTAEPEREAFWDYYGAWGATAVTDPDDDLLSTGRKWDSGRLTKRDKQGTHEESVLA